MREFYENLEKRGVGARCAVQVVDLNSGDVVHELRMEGLAKRGQIYF